MGIPTTSASGVQILIGDCRERLKTLPDKSVQMVCTSPPYFGLRDYETGSWDGGAEDCDHVVGEMRRGLGLASSPASTRGGAKKIAEAPDIMARQVCPHCGARRLDQQIGLEEDPQTFIAELVAVFREIWRVLRDDGTVWVNMGDSYANDTKWGGSTSGKHVRAQHGATGIGRRRHTTGLKSKDLMGIPWRVALALQADGWWLRRDIIWQKLNPMPESVRDRPTTSHEYLFLFSKSGDTLLWRAKDTGEFVYERPDMAEPMRDPQGEIVRNPKGDPKRRWFGLDYYYDADAIMEASSPDTHARAKRGRSAAHKYVDGGPGDQTIAKGSPVAGRIPLPGRASPKAADLTRESGIKANANRHEHMSAEVLPMRNKRSVWSTASEALSEAHYAAYPTALIEPAILAGCPPGGLVLDPFGGAGTTGLVAERLGRSAILIELSEKYAAMADRRLRAARCQVVTAPLDVPDAGPLFAEPTPPSVEIPSFLKRVADG